MQSAPLTEAIKKAGSVKALATLMGVRPQAVSQWDERGIPPRRVAKIAELTGIPPHEIRPDVFPFQAQAA